MNKNKKSCTALCNIITPLAKILRSPTWVLNESILQFCQLKVADNNFGVLQTVEVHQVLQLVSKQRQEQAGIFGSHSVQMLRISFQIQFHHPELQYRRFSPGVSVGTYLQISVDDFQRVQVSYGLQHLPHHVAGVPL